MQLAIYSALWFALVSVPSMAHLEAYCGAEPTDAVSNFFSVTLRDGPALMTPHVYMSSSPDVQLNDIHKDAAGRGIFCSLHGAQFCNRTASWVSFSRGLNGGAVILTVKSLMGPVFGNTSGPVFTSPSQGFYLNVQDEGHTVQMYIPGATVIPAQHFSLEYGTAPEGSFKHSMLIFAGLEDPYYGSPPPPNVLAFKQGVTRVPGDGILQLPPYVCSR